MLIVVKNFKNITFEVNFIRSDNLINSPQWNKWARIVCKHSKAVWKITHAALTLIGTREGTFHPLSFLDEILSAEFLSQISEFFWRWKLTSNRLIWHPAKLNTHWFLWKEIPLGGAKAEHFFCFYSSCQLGLSWQNCLWCIMISWK